MVRVKRPTLKDFVFGMAREKNLSLRKLAIQLDMSHSYLSEVLSGNKPLDIVLGNKIADFFNIQRVVLYQVAGWLDLNEDEELFQRFREYARVNPEFGEFIKAILDLKDEKERRRMLRLLNTNFH